MTPVIGSVSEGTLRLQELIPKFLDLLLEYNPGLWEKWRDPGSPEYFALPTTDDHPWWNSDDAHEVLHYLIEALDDLAPPKCYFGAHFGNSSDFGFWPL